MYCFLCHLALVDVGFTTSVVPPLLAILRGQVLRLEPAGCLGQLCPWALRVPCADRMALGKPGNPLAWIFPMHTLL